MVYCSLAIKILLAGLILTLISKSDWKIKIQGIFGIIGVTTLFHPVINALFYGKILNSGFYNRFIDYNFLCGIDFVTAFSILFISIFALIFYSYNLLDKKNDYPILCYIAYPLSLISAITCMIARDGLLLLLGIFIFLLAKSLIIQNQEQHIKHFWLNFISFAIVSFTILFITGISHSLAFKDYIQALRSNNVTSTTVFVLLTICFIINCLSYSAKNCFAKIVSKFEIILGLYLIVIFYVLGAFLHINF